MEERLEPLERVRVVEDDGGDRRPDERAVGSDDAVAEARRARTDAPPDLREQRLLPDEEKVARADYSYVNTGTLAELERFVRSVLDDVTG